MIRTSPFNFILLILLEVLPRFDLYFDEYNAPGIPDQSNQKKPKYFRKKKEA